MPWCETCSKFWSPASMQIDGSCPTCGRTLALADKPHLAGSDTSPVRPPITAENIDIRALAGDDARAPWHFKMLVVAVVGYLVWRVVQLVVWAVT